MRVKAELIKSISDVRSRKMLGTCSSNGLWAPFPSFTMGRWLTILSLDTSAKYPVDVSNSLCQGSAEVCLQFPQVWPNFGHNAA